MKTKFFALLLACICVLSCSAVYAAGTEMAKTTVAGQSADDGCNTKEELLDFLKLDAGGTVTLTGDILWDYTYNDLPRITNPAVVEMGAYKIIIPAECVMQIQGPVAFRGDGTVMFDAAGLLNLSYGVEVLSTGENAVAIQGAPTADLQFFICNITASRTNSTAIQSANPVTVQLCSVSGTTTAIEAPEITLDASFVYPELTEAAVIERVPTLDRSLRRYGITLPADVSQDQYKEAIYGYGDMQYAFIDPETGNAIGGPLASAWSNVPAWPAEAGSYTLAVKSAEMPDWFPVEVPSFDIPLHIVSKDTLWLNVGYADPHFGMLALQFAPNVPDETAQVTLFYSTDEGQSWRNVTEDFPDSTVLPNFIDVVGLEQNKDYWFYAEVTDGSAVQSSNIIYHPNFANDLDVDFSHGGGDRDEDDFGDQGEKPPSGEIIPPPDIGTSTDPAEDSAEAAANPGSDEPETADDTDETDSTFQTESPTSPVTDEASTKVPESEASPNTFDFVVIILGIAVADGIVCALLLRQKGGRR